MNDLSTYYLNLSMRNCLFLARLRPCVWLALGPASLLPELIQ